VGWKGLVVTGFIIWWIVVDPHGAALAAHKIAHVADVVFTGLSNFFSGL